MLTDIGYSAIAKCVRQSVKLLFVKEQLVFGSDD